MIQFLAECIEYVLHCAKQKSGQRIGQTLFLSHYQRKAICDNAQITERLHWSHSVQDQDQDRFFWSQTGLVLSPTVSEHITVVGLKTSEAIWLLYVAISRYRF